MHRLVYCPTDLPSQVITIQANLVLGLCELLTMTTNKAWLHIGLAIRLAQALRMRRESDRRLLPRQREVRRRTFWACVILDRLVAYCTFRTQTIELSLMELHLPCSEVSFAFGHDSPGPKIHELGGGDPPMAAEKMTLAYFIKTFSLWSPVARVYVDRGGRSQHLYRHKPAVTSSEYEAAMSVWKDSLPEEMQWSEHNLRAHQSLGHLSHFVSMHLLIQHAIFLVHHEYLPHPEEASRLQATLSNSSGVASTPNNCDVNAIEICLHGANQVVAMLRLTDSITAGLRCTHLGICVGLPIVTAAIVLLWTYHCSQKAVLSVQLSDSDISGAKSDVDFLVSLLDSWAETWDLARAWANSIRLLDDFYRSKYRCNQDDRPTANKSKSSDAVVSTLQADDEPGPEPPSPSRFNHGYPDLTMSPNDTYYKVRLITGLILEQPELCKKLLETSKELPAGERESGEQTDAWDIDLDLSWMNDPSLDMATSTLWSEFLM